MYTISASNVSVTRQSKHTREASPRCFIVVSAKTKTNLRECTHGIHIVERRDRIRFPFVRALDHILQMAQNAAVIILCHAYTPVYKVMKPKSTLTCFSTCVSVPTQSGAGCPEVLICPCCWCYDTGGFCSNSATRSCSAPPE